METNTKKLTNALQDVRRAHRILYAYQRRMLDLVHFIRSKLDMPVKDLCGVKHFSRPIKKNKGYLTIWHDMWAWDYLYSYLFEYYLGEQKTSNEAYEYKLSLIQYSDTGYFDQEEEGTRLELEKFKPEDKSSSKLLFFLEYKPKDSEWVWKDGSYMERIVLNKEFGSKEHTKTVRDTATRGTQILCSFPLERFINMEATLEVLREFRSFCQKQEIHVFDNLTLEPTCTSTSSSSEG